MPNPFQQPYCTVNDEQTKAGGQCLMNCVEEYRREVDSVDCKSGQGCKSPVLTLFSHTPPLWIFNCCQLTSAIECIHKMNPKQIVPCAGPIALSFSGACSLCAFNGLHKAVAWGKKAITLCLWCLKLQGSFDCMMEDKGVVDGTLSMLK